MSYSKEKFIESKKEEHRKAKAEREEMRPSLEAKYKHQSDNCPDCFGKDKENCLNPVHF